MRDCSKEGRITWELCDLLRVEVPPKPKRITDKTFPAYEKWNDFINNGHLNYYDTKFRLLHFFLAISKLYGHDDITQLQNLLAVTREHHPELKEPKPWWK
jgi:hypothetical protein